MGTPAWRNRTVTQALPFCNLVLLEYPNVPGWIGVPGVDRRSRCGVARELAKGGKSVYFLPWWVLLACLAASAFAAYFLLGRTQAGDTPWALFPLTAVLAPVVLVGTVVAAIVLSTFLSALSEGQIGTRMGPSEPPPQTEGTYPEAAPEGTGAVTTLERTAPTTTTIPSASPTVSPTASSTASPTASPSP